MNSSYSSVRPILESSYCGKESILSPKQHAATDDLCLLFCIYPSSMGLHFFPEILHYYTTILQVIRVIVEDAGLEPGTSEVRHDIIIPSSSVYCRTPHFFYFDDSKPEIDILSYSFF